MDWRGDDGNEHCWMTTLDSDLLTIGIDSDTAADIRLFESEDDTSQCYESLYYGEYHHAPMLMVRLNLESSARITTTIRCGEPKSVLGSP